MTSLKLKTSNIASFSNTDSAYLVGKNGFNTELGTIPVYVSAVSKTDYDSNIVFTVRGLHQLFDTNTGVHILNNNTFASQKQIVFDVLLNSSDTEYGEVAYVNPLVPYSSNVIQFYTSNNTLKIANPSVGGSDLYSKLDSAPFYAKLFQPLATNNYTDKAMFVSGTTLNVVKEFNVFSNTGSYTANVVLQPENSKFITVYLDGIKQSSSIFTWDNRANITLTLDNTYTSLKTRVTKYTVPTIENGDNVYLIYANTYSISNVSYIPTDGKYNSLLTANSIYRIYTTDNLKVNATSFTATNMSPNPYGVIGNVIQANNTFTLDYDGGAYPGNFALANNAVYKLIKGNKYTPLNLPEGRTLYNVPSGTVSVRARNTNSIGRKSAYATATVIVEDLLLPSVTNLTVTESLYLDTTQGVATRATVKFDHNPDSEILSYEVSYKIEAEDSENTTNFITAQVPITAVDASGQVNYIINNIDRGRSSGVNYLVVRVTPINNSLTGATKQIVHVIIGKTAPPANVTSFNYAQNSNTLTLFWTFALNSDGTLQDLDLQEVEIRRVQGQLTTASQYLAAWNSAQLVSTIAIPSTNHGFGIDAYGVYTYLIKTRDTSRNESDSVLGVSFTLNRPTNLSAFKTWSEDEPSANNSVAFLGNSNYYEYNWPSFSNSDNQGLYYAGDDPITPGVGPSTLTENANGTSSGFVVGSNSTDLLVSANAFYQTAVRDLGQQVIGRFSTDINVYSILASTWYSMRENLVSGVSDSNPSSTILWDAGSYIGNILTSNSAIYSSENRTLVSNDSFGNVYAIWNSGQFAGDVANANTFALIAGVINANAIALGESYNASGSRTGSNAFANLTTSSGTYQLVNLKQWGDPEGLGNWQGPDGLVSYNLELRYSTNNVYFSGSNANVNVISFSSSNTGAFAQYASGEIDVRWFQFRVWVRNDNPALASAIFDKFRYTCDLTTKSYTTTVAVTSNPTIVDLSTQNFKSTPAISLTPVVNTALRINNTFPSYSDVGSNATQANITVYSNTGAFVSGALVVLTATGF